MPQLRRQFTATIKLGEGEALVTKDADCFVAIGAALAGEGGELFSEAKLLLALQKLGDAPLDAVAKLPPLFSDAKDHEEFTARHARSKVERGSLADYTGRCYLGIDAGSTTLKMALLSEDGKLLWSQYSSNHGNPVQVAAAALSQLYSLLPPGAVIGGCRCYRLRRRYDEGRLRRRLR